MTGRALWSVLRRSWVVATAALGAVANLLCIILTFHRDALTTHDFDHGVVAGVWLALLFGIPLLPPSFALYVFRRFAPVVILLTTLLLLILTMNINELIRYRESGIFERFPKWDTPGVALLFLSMFAAAMVVVRAIIWLVVLLQGDDPDTSAS
ncbi:hypothetical protein; putative membrane protein [Bradyrhizobium sp. ORS 285]|uniref:hypothetical protein n=1 Tax=Bradyrhizobium sp. ORS 285 TaxID=115808 RepID=UPI00024083A0|nr:hypothetical protein [Bradyrhizobium sp. ORS 285]CCD84477.1 conserved membrane hypothetical protein [Bradyrhizobium sp. ORS 285]SMX57276.1 hypothetical protein; putative membrane protein [Bradyrhizobium sp. ORS 285]